MSTSMETPARMMGSRRRVRERERESCGVAVVVCSHVSQMDGYPIALSINGHAVPPRPNNNHCRSVLPPSHH